MKLLNIPIETIDQCLPQTQCGDCGYSGCLPYATAIVKDNAPLDRCLPGGLPVLHQLGNITGKSVTDLEADLKKRSKPKKLAVIREAECIGCTKCIQACPVDAIFGATKQMHTVISQECTGCALCVEPCPMDCIDLLPTEDPTYYADHARKRYLARNARLTEQKQIKARADKKRMNTDHATKQAAIRAAMTRIQKKSQQ